MEEKLPYEHIKDVVTCIWSQIVATSNGFTLLSWGISKLHGKVITEKVNGMPFTMAALVMTVHGASFKGDIYIALDEAADYYRIYLSDDEKLVEKRHDVGCEELAAVLNDLI